MRLVVGLGNPGAQYEQNRHNAGFRLLDKLTADNQLNWAVFKGGLVSEIFLGGQKHLLLKPQKFMNLSGQVIRAVQDFYKIELLGVALVYDDVYLAPGTARIRLGGGDGGHNGLKSAIESLGSDEFWRIRLGVGLYEQHLQKRIEQPALDAYVLQNLPKNEDKLLMQMIDKLASDLLRWLEHGELEGRTLHL